MQRFYFEISDYVRSYIVRDVCVPVFRFSLISAAIAELFIPRKTFLVGKYILSDLQIPRRQIAWLPVRREDDYFSARL